MRLAVVAVAFVLVGATACSSSADTHIRDGYPVWSDGWRPGEPAQLAAIGGPFHARLTDRGVCAWLGSADQVEPTQWPAGWRVRLHPTVLIDDKGVVVAQEGDLLFAGGGVRPVGTGKSPRCGGPGQPIIAIQGRVERRLADQ